jgi:hypothetical protein
VETTVPGWPAYFVTDDGRVLSRWICGTSKGAVLSVGPVRQLVPYPIKGGYLQVALRDGHGGGRRVGIHELVLEAFVGPKRKGDQARHLNGVPADNRLVNLCWGTARANAEDRERHGNTARGERSGKSRLIDSQVRAIRADRRSVRRVAAEYGVDPGTVQAIRSGRTWKHLLQGATP